MIASASPLVAASVKSLGSKPLSSRRRIAAAPLPPTLARLLLLLVILGHAKHDDNIVQYLPPLLVDASSVRPTFLRRLFSYRDEDSKVMDGSTASTTENLQDIVDGSNDSSSCAATTTTATISQSTFLNDDNNNSGKKKKRRKVKRRVKSCNDVVEEYEQDQEHNQKRITNGNDTTLEENKLGHYNDFPDSRIQSHQSGLKPQQNHQKFQDQKHEEEQSEDYSPPALSAETIATLKPNASLPPVSQQGRNAKRKSQHESLSLITTASPSQQRQQQQQQQQQQQTNLQQNHNTNERNKNDDDFHDSQSAQQVRSSFKELQFGTSTKSPSLLSSLSSITTTCMVTLQDHMTPERILRLSLSGIQLGICYFIAKSIWGTICEVLEEVDHDFHHSNGNNAMGSGNNMQEDHDLPFLSEESVDSFVSNVILNSEMAAVEAASAAETSSKEGGQESKDKDTIGKDGEGKPTKSSVRNDLTQHPVGNNDGRHGRHNTGSSSNRSPGRNKKFGSTSNIGRGENGSVMSNLAIRLHASGLPLADTNQYDNHHRQQQQHHHQQSKNVQNILKSLTRTEGQLLSNTLLSPIDTHENGVILGSPERNSRVVEMWNEIGGLEEVKEALLDLVFPMLLLGQQHTTASAPSSSTENSDGTTGVGENNSISPTNKSSNTSYYGGLLSNPPGVLLYGPPGCGKTMLVRALAHTAKARFLCVTPSTLLRKYVGETNLNVRALFSLARKISPCIIFIDEMEGLFRERGGSSSGGGGGGGEEHEVSRELKTEFMQLWDGISSGNGENEHVLVVGATNRPFDVDSAFLRRMPRSFFVGLPDYSSRTSILKSMLQNVPIADDFDLDNLARVTEGYSPSDLREVLRTAALNPLREARAMAVKQAMQEHQHQQESGGSFSPIPSLTGVPPLRPLTTSDIMQARGKVSPTQFSANYRAALVDYANRASGGRARLREMMGDSEQSSLWHDHGQFTNQFKGNNQATFYADAGTVEGNANESPTNNYQTCDFEESSGDFDDSSSSFDYDD